MSTARRGTGTPFDEDLSKPQPEDDDPVADMVKITSERELDLQTIIAKHTALRGARHHAHGAVVRPQIVGDHERR